MGESAEWVVELGKEMVDRNEEQWKKRSIYKVPGWVKDLKPQAYKPQAVSFGPYHHGEEQLKQMEGHKKRALHHFIERSNKDVKTFVEALMGVEQELKESYDSLDPAWLLDPKAFLQLMLRDGCFMLEILRIATSASDSDSDSDSDGYDKSDPIFSHHGKLYIMPYIRRDMLMIQNQLPMLLLRELVAVESGITENDELLNSRILKFCDPNTPLHNIGTCLHALDAYRKSLLHQQVPSGKSQHKGGHESSGAIVRSATELDEAGIFFKKSKSRSLKDISFHCGVLKLPVITVDDTTESAFLNLMAFERFHVGAGNEITSYIFFMDNIIDNARDVSLLHSKGIIQNAIGSDKAVAKLFNSLSKDVTLDPESSLHKVHQKVNDYCKMKINAWRANLIHTYFRNPWAILSFVAAIFLMTLTIAQTVYTIYPYYNSKDSPPLSPPITPSSPH
ncbi:hypothetical protein HHK36_025322 [Tetracentron sinense]|uniref:Uncharacterized protein n=1 Tax=Tetracentron sinense TaxID=13715 RepID=A0A834YKP0_TETSI|nr:hypothetical protein HHK36_025322 [Tetracentron sinense]